MFHNEQDNQNTQYRTFHPFTFISLIIGIVLVLAICMQFLTKPRKIIHTIEHLKLHVSHNSLQTAQKPPWQTFTVKSGDNLKTIFTRAGINQETYYKINQMKTANSFFNNLHPKQAFYVLFDDKHHLKKLILRIDKLHYYEITSNNDQWQAELMQLDIEKKTQAIKGYIQQSFAQTANNLGIAQKFTTELTDIFSSRIDFTKQIRPHDEFKIIYEQYYSGDKEIKSGHLLAAEFITHNNSYYAIRYKNHHGLEGYYMPNGENWLLAFIRTPVKYTRISSKFGSRRLHPILHIVRPHEGVDLASPRGTPIKASGDGKIIFHGRKGGYGKAIIIKHNRIYTTLYAHMSRFAPALHVGSRVKEGEVIGYVGMTGLATGPHLHYEFHIRGIPHDPMKIKLPHARSIAKKERKEFLTYAKQMVNKLNQI